MKTDTLELEDFFDVRDIATKARAFRDEINETEDSSEIDPDTIIALNLMNAGLHNFLTGEYAAVEPEKNEDVEAWAIYAEVIAEQFERIGDEQHVTFHHEDEVLDVLAEQAEEFGYLKDVPDVLKNAIDYAKVERGLRSCGGFDEMFIDGETYVTNVLL